MEPLKIFIGWDSKEPEAYDVCKYSIEKRSSVPVDIQPLKIRELREDRVYWRPEDIGSTEFTITRFLVPYLTDYKGFALFCDCDFLFLDDVAKLFEQADYSKAVQVVQHNYVPTETKKFLNNKQYVYPRKNWSSLMLWNCEHHNNKEMNVYNVNAVEPGFLHQFKWLKDDHIGSLSHEWNWLEGHYKEPQDGSPKAVHYTRGGPWFKDWKDVEYASLWEKEFKELTEIKNV
jgi:lipopolysaccharide biosynthesis glycosyltransferase